MCSVTVSFVLSRINAYISMIAANCQELYSLRDYNNTTTEELKKKKNNPKFANNVTKYSN